MLHKYFRENNKFLKKLMYDNYLKFAWHDQIVGLASPLSLLYSYRNYSVFLKNDSFQKTIVL
jgi:hypothetical protein